jgi:8-oxo-dGTP diphosphatase
MAASRLMEQQIRFCPQCSGELRPREDDGRTRLTCRSCGFIFYRNPLPGVAVVLIEDGRILLARRRSSLFDGMWCIPCGYVEIDESVQEAARREFREETGLEVEVGEVMLVYSSFEVAHRPVIGIWFRGQAVGGQAAPGKGVRELAFFPLETPPAELAFEGDRLVIDMLQRHARGGAEGRMPGS